MLKDVLVGDVWIGSGQSNMAGGVGGYARGDEVLAKLAEGTYPQLRFCRGKGGSWQQSTPETNRGVSALLFSFGQRLQEELDVPVGLILGAVGGTPSGRWLTDEMVTKGVKGKDFRAANGDDLYRQHILPVVPYGIRGVLWDQGESGTAMVTARDLGSGIHPRNKSGYGHRAAQVALGFVYKQKVEIYSPIYASHKVVGDKIRVQFKHVGGGLATKYGDGLQGFAVAGKNGKYHWATAVIDGDSVVVSSSEVPQPVAVQYVWDGNSPWTNLFNKDGLPALIFRAGE